MPSNEEFLSFSAVAYDEPALRAGTAQLPPNWHLINQSSKQASEEDGYSGAAFVNDKTGEVVVANRGSRDPRTGPGLRQDWLGSDPKIAAQDPKRIPKAFDDARSFATDVRKQFPNAPIYFTGHSLGGAEAQVQAATVTGSRATTFAAPGAKFAVSSDQGAKAAGNVVNYVLPGDLVGARGDHIGITAVLIPAGGILLKDAGAVAIGELVGLLFPPLGLLVTLALFTAANHPLSNYAAALKGTVASAAATSSGGGKAAARLTDMHVCPMFTGIVPHVGGPIVSPGAPTVLINGIPAARVSDIVQCVGLPDIIAFGASAVLIAGQPAARFGDMTAHGGSIVSGMPTVLIGG